MAEAVHACEGILCNSASSSFAKASAIVDLPTPDGPDVDVANVKVECEVGHVKRTRPSASGKTDRGPLSMQTDWLGSHGTPATGTDRIGQWHSMSR